MSADEIIAEPDHQSGAPFRAKPVPTYAPGAPKLRPHLEGAWYRETWRADAKDGERSQWRPIDSTEILSYSSARR